MTDHLHIESVNGELKLVVTQADDWAAMSEPSATEAELVAAKGCAALTAEQDAARHKRITAAKRGTYAVSYVNEYGEQTLSVDFEPAHVGEIVATILRVKAGYGNVSSIAVTLNV